MGATPEVTSSDTQDELAAILGHSKPGAVVEDPEPDPALEEAKAPEKKPDGPVGDKKTDEKPDDAAKPTEPKDDLLSIAEQNRELRQILRQQKRDMSIMQSKLSRLEKRSVEASKQVEDVVDDSALFGKPDKKADTPAAPTAEELSPLENLQAELATISRVKGPILETLLEVMEVSPAYADVRAVCSQSNFDDMFEAIGEAIAAKEGKDASIAALEAEAAVWKMPNPYKYMFGLIKQYHPKYAGRHQDKTEDKGKDAGKKPADAPASIANVPGKGAPTNAWTAARIDEMDEMELHKVPSEIYDKYLAGELE
jgi:hypothetical protein